jgi:hypothetical protein
LAKASKLQKCCDQIIIKWALVNWMEWLYRLECFP